MAIMPVPTCCKLHAHNYTCIPIFLGRRGTPDPTGQLVNIKKKIQKCPFTYWLNGRWFLQIVDRDSWNIYPLYPLFPCSDFVSQMWGGLGGGGCNVFSYFMLFTTFLHYFSFNVFFMFFMLEILESAPSLTG